MMIKMETMMMIIIIIIRIMTQDSRWKKDNKSGGTNVGKQSPPFLDVLNRNNTKLIRQNWWRCIKTWCNGNSFIIMTRLLIIHHITLLPSGPFHLKTSSSLNFLACLVTVPYRKLDFEPMHLNVLATVYPKRIAAPHLKSGGAHSKFTCQMCLRQATKVNLRWDGSIRA